MTSDLPDPRTFVGAETRLDHRQDHANRHCHDNVSSSNNMQSVTATKTACSLQPWEQQQQQQSVTMTIRLKVYCFDDYSSNNTQPVAMTTTTTATHIRRPVQLPSNVQLDNSIFIDELVSHDRIEVQISVTGARNAHSADVDGARFWHLLYEGGRAEFRIVVVDVLNFQQDLEKMDYNSK